MPLIEIHALPQPSHIDPSAVLAAVNRAVGDALGRPSEVAWSTWSNLEPGHYLVGETATDAQPASTHSPIVHVYAERSPDVMAQIIEVIASTLAECLGVDADNVFVTAARVSAHVS
jgi:phenylpyruvate tautomerase PptA (4-oxalocrotonate tautomerase family)